MFNGAKISNKNLQLWTVTLLLILPFSAAYAATVDFNAMLNALKDNAAPIIRFIIAIAYVMGIWFIISGIMSLKKVGNSSHMQMQSQGGIGGPLMRIIIGVLLIYAPSTIDVGVWTLWGHTALGSSAKNFMEYSSDQGGPFLPAKEGAIAVIRIVGYVSFVRGFSILSKGTYQGAQPGNFGKGFIHIIGGILAINIVETIRIITNTLGIT